MALSPEGIANKLRAKQHFHDVARSVSPSGRELSTPQGGGGNSLGQLADQTKQTYTRNYINALRGVMYDKW